MAVSKRLRYEILRRDNHTCRYCGASAPDVALAVDHVIPVALGGSDDPTNLVAACRDCNAGKSASAPDAPIVDDVNALALRYREAFLSAVVDRSLDRQLVVDFRDAFYDEWRAWTDRDGDHEPLPSGWEASIDQLHNAGLDEREIPELIEAAMHAKARDTWRYFCGCAWRRIRENHDRAMATIAGQSNGA